jgi:hypothetical protein
MRTHGSDGATEPGRDGPGPIGPSRLAWPSSGVGSAPLSLHPKDLQPFGLGDLDDLPEWVLGHHRDGVCAK